MLAIFLSPQSRLKESSLPSFGYEIHLDMFFALLFWIAHGVDFDVADVTSRSLGLGLD